MVYGYRFDLAFGINFDFDNLDNNNLYIGFGGQRPIEMNDVYFLSGYGMMRHISEFFDYGLGNYVGNGSFGNGWMGTH